MSRPPSSVQRASRWKPNQATNNYLLLNLKSKFEEAQRANEMAEDMLAISLLKNIIVQITQQSQDTLSSEMKELRVKAKYLLADLEEHEIA